MIIGLVCAYMEAGNIGGAVDSLRAAGCGRVVVVDGAWTCPDGSLFGRSFLSDDGTREEAVEACAELVDGPDGADDGGKRDWAIRNCGAEAGDHLLLLDADERIEGLIDTEHAPSEHGCVVLWNDKPNDLLETRTSWLDGGVRTNVPMLRWLRWTPELRCHAPGRYHDRNGRVIVYLTEALADRAQVGCLDRFGLAALAALRTVETRLPNDRLSWLPIVEGIEIRHNIEASPDRVAAKRRYYREVPT